MSTNPVREPRLAERDSTADQRAALVRAVFAALDATGLRYVIPRNWQRLPHEPGKDIDILIPVRELPGAVEAIRAQAHRLGFASVVRRTDGRGLGVDVIGWRPAGLAGEPLGVGFDLRCWLSFPTSRRRLPEARVKVFAEELQARQVEHNGMRLRVLSPMDEWIALYAQYLMKRYRGIEHKAAEYAGRLERMLEDRQLAESLCRATGSSDRDALLARALASSPDPALASDLLRERWGRRWPGRWLLVQLRAFELHVRTRAPSMGPIVYFSGPDGAGKTTVTRGVAERLAACGVPFRRRYSLKIVLRAITRRLAFVKKIGRGRLRPDDVAAQDGPDLLFLTEDTRDRDTGSPLWRFRKRMALLVGIADIWIGWLLMLPARLRGAVVLVETAPYDIFVKYHMPEFPALERRLGPLLPRPSVGLLMEADPQSILRRRAELTLEEIRDYYRRFACILQRCRAQDRYVRVRTDRDPEASITEASTAVLAATR